MTDEIVTLDGNCFEVVGNKITVKPVFSSGPDIVLQGASIIASVSGYTLTEDSVTSAGVYKEDGTLLRTLWSNVAKNAGTYPAPVWDGLDDDGNAVAGDKIIVLSNNVQYQWEGVIGNTSNINGGPTVHQNFEPINGMSHVGDYTYYSCGYNEHPPAWMKFHKDTPNIKIKVLPNIHYGMTVLFTCTDGNVVYMGGYDPWQPVDSEVRDRNFIIGINPTNDTQQSFSAGSPYNPVSGHTYTSAIARVDDINARITGMSVGINHLFVSRAAQNKIDVYNKVTGAFVRSLSSTDPHQTVCFGSEIWVISRGKVEKHPVNTNGTLGGALVTLTGITSPTYITVNSSGTVAVTDEGTQQVKIFKASGILTNTLGVSGGYSTGPAVNTGKFFLTPKSFGSANPYKTFVSFQPDGKLWIGDVGNFRSLRFSASYVYEDQISYTGYFRSMGVDPANPQRVFCNYLEFDFNYTTKEWSLKNNWSYNITPETDDEYHRLKWVQTLSNGKTYAFQDSNGSNWAVIELTSAGVRYTGITFPKSNNTIFMHGGAVRTFKDIQECVPCWWKERALIGFDGNNPTWGPEVTIGTAPNTTDEDPTFRPFVGWNHPPNADTDNLLISFEGGSANETYASEKYHLGGVRKGESTWAFKTAKSLGKDYTGDYPNDGSYDIGNNTQYPGGIILCKEKSIFWGHHGEFWKNMQTNKIQHVYENGLLVGVFGVTGEDAVEDGIVWDNIPYPGMAGNNIKADIVKVGADYYIFHCDEGHHGGVHRWKVSGLDTITEHIITL